MMGMTPAKAKAIVLAAHPDAMLVPHGHKGWAIRCSWQTLATSHRIQSKAWINAARMILKRDKVK